MNKAREAPLRRDPTGGPHAARLEPGEVAELEQREANIERGLHEIGDELLAIHDQRLYRDHGTFKDYLRRRWELKPSRGHQLIDAVRVVRNLKSSTNGGTFPGELPRNERQIRPLTVLEPALQVVAWSRIIETTPDGKITGRHVAEVVAELQATPAPAAAGEGDERVEANGSRTPPDPGGPAAEPAALPVEPPPPPAAGADLLADLPDDRWLELCGVVRDLLPGAARARYDHDALLYRRTTAVRNHARRQLKEIIAASKTGPRGPFARALNNYLQVSHPRHWLRCGRCDGQGVLDGGRCGGCWGAGYTIRTETE